jgi:hypothetical protein
MWKSHCKVPWSLLWFGHEVSPKGSCFEGLVLNTNSVLEVGLWKIAGLLIINGLICWWVWNLNRLLEGVGTAESRAYRRKVGHWVHAQEKYNLCQVPSCSLLPGPGSKQLLSTTCSLPSCSASPWPRNHGARWPWTKISETVSQNKSFLLLFSQVSVTVIKSLTNTVITENSMVVPQNIKNRTIK